MYYNKYELEGKEACWRFAFAQRLRDVLKQKNFTIVQFTRQTGIPKSSMDGYLNGSSIPNYFRMSVMAEVLDMPLDKLTDIRPNADLFDDVDEDEE